MHWHHATPRSLADRVRFVLRGTAVLCPLAGLLVLLAASSVFAATQRDFYPLALDTRASTVTITGHVRDDFNSFTVAHASVRLIGPGGAETQTTTSPLGFFEFQGLDPATFPPSSSRVLVSHLGYLPGERIGLSATNANEVRLVTRTVVLIHGLFGGFESTWGGYFGALPTALRNSGHYVVGVDLGGSPHNYQRIPNAVLSVESQLYRECLNRGIQSFHVVGHSMGGLIARNYNLRSAGRDRVQRMVMLGTPNHGSYVANAVLGGALGVDVLLTILLFPSHWPGTTLGNVLDTAIADLAVGSE
jgi:pimeloyl-ACP methyl ester carboxylesterase